MFKHAVTALILAVGMIVSAWLVSNFFVKVRQEKEIRVKGYAEQPVAADVGTLSFRIEVREPTLKDASRRLKADVAAVLDSLADHTELTIEPAIPAIHELMKRGERGEPTHEVEAYELSQNVLLTSRDVRLIAALPAQLARFIDADIKILVHSPNFYVSDLDQYKKALIEQATRNGLERARILADNSGGKVGSLISASQGVFQITTPNSTETSGYGMYDTSTIDKVIKAVVSLDYAIE